MKYAWDVIARFLLAIGYLLIAVADQELAKDLAVPYAVICLVIAVNDFVHLYGRRRDERTTSR